MEHGSSLSNAGLPGVVARYLYQQDPGFQVVRLIRDKFPRVVLHVRVKGRDCLVKALKDNAPWTRPGRYFRFQKEIFIYTRLNRLKFKDFRYPALIHARDKLFIVTDFISNNPSLCRDHVFFSQAMKAVLEMNTCSFPFNDNGGIGWFWEKSNRWKFSRTTKTLRNLCEGCFVKRKISGSMFVRLLAFWRESLARTAVLSTPLLVHRDIFSANILRPDRETIVFADFEKMGVEKRWVFGDALKIAQAEPLFFPEDERRFAGFPRFHAGLLETFWKDMVSIRPAVGQNHDDFKCQLKFCLLGWILKKLVKEKQAPKQDKNLTGFIEKVILGPDHIFDCWLEQCRQIKAPGATA